MSQSISNHNFDWSEKQLFFKIGQISLFPSTLIFDSAICVINLVLCNFSRVALNQQTFRMFRAVQSLFYIQKLPLSVGLLSRSYHILSTKPQQNQIGGSITSSTSNTTILSSTNIPQLTKNCGLKIVGHVHRRCRDCRLMTINGVVFNHCKTHPRHKQRQRLKPVKNTWTLTAVQQTKKRPWWMNIQLCQMSFKKK